MSFFSDSFITAETFSFIRKGDPCQRSSQIRIRLTVPSATCFASRLPAIRRAASWSTDDASNPWSSRSTPFTPQSAISHALINGSYIPVFCGCGGAADSRSHAKNPRGVPRCAHHCERRQQRREHTGDHCGRGKRHHLYASFHCRTLKTHDGKVPRKRNDFHLDSKLDKLSSLFYTGLVVFRAG